MFNSVHISPEDTAPAALKDTRQSGPIWDPTTAPTARPMAARPSIAPSGGTCRSGSRVACLGSTHAVLDLTGMEAIMEMAEVQAVIADASKTEEQKAREIVGMSSPRDPKTIRQLWLILVGGLVSALLLSVAGVLVAVLDGKDVTSPDVLITMFTTTSAGLLGLFVKSPTTPEANS